jgi:hypothetical protein
MSADEKKTAEELVVATANTQNQGLPNETLK